MQLPLIVPQTTWKAPRLVDLPSWSNAKRIAIDIETCDPKLRTLGPGVRRGAYIVGISFAIEDGPKHYLPLRHAGGGNMEDAAQTMGWVKEQAKNFTGEIVGANLGYDLDFLWHVGIIFPHIKRYRDVQIAQPLINDLQLSYSLETLCNDYLGIGKDESLLREAAIAYRIDPKKEMYQLPAGFVGAYAEADATLPLLVLRRQENEIEAQELWPIYNMESDLLPTLVRMRQRGVRVDLSKLEQVERWSVAEEKKALAEVERLTGHIIPFDSVWQASVLVKPLQSIGCKIPLTAKTKKPSIDKNFLKTINHPVAEAINRARRVNKIRTTFAQSIRNHAIGDRIHCTFHQLRSSTEEDVDGEGVGARYGRCSSQNPNMQQQPARDPEIGPMWRSIYIPEEGELWCSADFSSQEPRQAVHYATTVKLGNVKVRTPNGTTWVSADNSAAEMAQKYIMDAATDPHQALADIIMDRKATKQERADAKTIFLGLSYGMGGAKLCRQLGLPTAMVVRDPAGSGTAEVSTVEGKRWAAQGGKIYEAAGPAGQELLDKFDASVPFVRALSTKCKQAATRNGYVRTQAGRKCRFPPDDYGNLMETHKSLNKLIQGSSADQTKISLIELDREGIFTTLQIHDECCASIPDRNTAKKIVEIMENTYKLAVPNKVDCEIGSSWGEAK